MFLEQPGAICTAGRSFHPAVCLNKEEEGAYLTKEPLGNGLEVRAISPKTAWFLGYFELTSIRRQRSDILHDLPTPRQPLQIELQLLHWTNRIYSLRSLSL